MLGYGVDIGIAYTLYLNDLYGWRRAFDNMFSNFGEVMDELDHAGTVTVASMLNMEFGKFTLNTGLGRFFTYGANYTSVSGQNFMFGPLVKVTFDYQFSDLLSAGLYAKHNVVLVDLDDIRQFSNAGLYMGLSF